MSAPARLAALFLAPARDREPAGESASALAGEAASGSVSAVAGEAASGSVSAVAGEAASGSVSAVAGEAASAVGATAATALVAGIGPSGSPGGRGSAELAGRPTKGPYGRALRPVPGPPPEPLPDALQVPERAAVPRRGPRGGRPPSAAAGRGIPGAARPEASVCVLGGGRASVALGHALARRLACAPGPSPALALVATVSGEVPGPAAGWPATPAARRAARTLGVVAAPALARGRVLGVGLPEEPAALAITLADVRRVLSAHPWVTVLPGVRRRELDPVVAAHRVVVVVLATGADPALSALAAAEIAGLGPDVAVVPVVLPQRLGATARRAAVARTLAVIA